MRGYYSEDMESPTGGLKLRLDAAARDDSRLRFAVVSLQAADSAAEFELVTDSDGRLRRHLRAGEYRLRCEYAPEMRFTVADRGWTSVRVRLV